VARRFETWFDNGRRVERPDPPPAPPRPTVAMRGLRRRQMSLDDGEPLPASRRPGATHAGDSPAVEDDPLDQVLARGEAALAGVHPVDLPPGCDQWTGHTISSGDTQICVPSAANWNRLLALVSHQQRAIRVLAREVRRLERRGEPARGIRVRE
jgi:hypothetical protein